MKRDITTDTTELQRIIRNYTKLYINQLGNLKVNKFGETYNLPSLNEKNIKPE